MDLEITEPGTLTAETGPRRVLIIDDNQDYRDVIHYLLTSQGYHVDVAEDGAQGVKQALKVQPDMILLDFNMPELNGYEVIQELRRHDETRKTPIVMFTGATNRKHLKEMRMDIVDFLEKPVSNSQLLTAVSRVFKGNPIPRRADEQAAAGPERPIARPAPEVPSSSVLALEAQNVVSKAAEEALHKLGTEMLRSGASVLDMEPIVDDAAEEVAMPEGMRALEDLEGKDLSDDSELLVDIERDDSEDEGNSSSGLEVLANDSPLINRVNKILVKAVEMGASDIHIEPQEKEILVRVRINGSLKLLCSLPASLSARLGARVKIMSDLVVTERRLPQDGQFRATIGGKKFEFRVSTLPSLHGEKVVLRILGGNKLKSGLKDLGLSERDELVVEQVLKTPHGLVLVTGPTGSGKTTTLYSMIAAVNQPDVNVMTAEDPIEYRLPGITQTHVKPGIGLTFESVLRSFLRQDPDIMLVGEIRDLETAEIAAKASITGHLVLSTLHTNSAPATITRLTHMGLPPFLVAASVKLVVAQRLIKVLCSNCKLEVPLSSEDKRSLTEGEIARVKSVYRSVGCKDCNQSGFSGRRPIFEVMPVRTPEMRNAILLNGSLDQLAKIVLAEGMVPLREAALGAVIKGDTSLTEALKIMLAE